MTFANCNSYFIAMGGNQPSFLGDSVLTLREALRQIGREIGPVTALSRFWQTPAYPAGSGPDYINAALVCASALPPQAVLERLHKIEAGLGRSRKLRWESRVIDLDILACGDRILPDLATLDQWMTLPDDAQRRLAPDRLILPHPRMHERAFVLAPLAEIAPDWVHPVLGRSVRALLQDLPQDAMTGLAPITSA